MKSSHYRGSKSSHLEWMCLLSELTIVPGLCPFWPSTQSFAIWPCSFFSRDWQTSKLITTIPEATPGRCLGGPGTVLLAHLIRCVRIVELAFRYSSNRCTLLPMPWVSLVSLICDSQVTPLFTSHYWIGISHPQHGHAKWRLVSSASDFSCPGQGLCWNWLTLKGICPCMALAGCRSTRRQQLVCWPSWRQSG